MKKIIAIALLTLGSISINAQPAAENSLIKTQTTAPVLLTTGAGVSFALTEEPYKQLMKQLTRDNYIQIKTKPANLSANARYGINLVVNRKNVGWILDGDAASGYTFYADWNADGDLSNDPVTVLEKNDGKYAHVFSKTFTDDFENQQKSYSYDLKVEVVMIEPPGETEKQLALKIYDRAAREGTLKVGDKQVKFRLSGSTGIYNTQYDSLYFDLDGDNKFDSAQYSIERFKIPEKYVNIGDVSYEYMVDRYGQELTLKPLAEKRPARFNLAPGNLAPEITFTDIEGKARRLSDYRGKVVLLDFWGLWCAPCVAEAPSLAANYKRLKEKGFEIVSFDEGDTIENLQKFIAQKQMNWTHAQMDAALKALYRVDAFPTYFLLDKEGKIISNKLRPGDALYQKIEEMTKQ